jgi:hypothetical protein
MSESGEHEPRAEPERDAAGVLANLPRTRPQRSSARRIAAREGANGASTPARSAKAPARSAKRDASARAAATRTSAKRPKTATRKRPARARPSAERERAPRQGFESDGDSGRGPVSPPGGAELITAATELLTEVTKAGLSRGADTLRDLASRLRLG